jgi:hypothetical protein
MKVAINMCYGGFALSKKAVLWMAERGCDAAAKEIAKMAQPKEREWWKWDEGDTGKMMSYSWHPWDDDLPRHDPLLIECIETLGDKADGPCSSITIVEIPDGVKYEIDEYDGLERIHEEHRSWP